MVNTTEPFTFDDVDFQLDGSGEVYRAKSINVNKIVETIDGEQGGTQNLDHIVKRVHYEWTITIDEVSGNWSTLAAWADGATCHDIHISKGALDHTVSDCFATAMSNDHAPGISTITISGYVKDSSTVSEA